MGTNGSTMLEPLRQGLPPLDPAAVSNAASCALPARYEAVREARQFTRRTLDQWDVGDRFDDVCLVVSELVTNALRHALPSDKPRVDDQGPPVRLHLMRWTERLVCAVRDPSHDSPVAGDSEDFSAESGRGLFLVDSFADSWGWHPLAGTLSGKVVWALFRLPSTPGATPATVPGE
ncbi:ATP-binding protein [Streptomyces sp. NPDC058614]|uniref:ATP-binding protein n=1 Tax=Streptomyces sp. NPDC058614 TaxID=3346557 RepID=UPI00366A0553